MPPPSRVNFVEGSFWAGVGGTTYASPAQSVTSGNTLVACIGGQTTTGQSVTGVADTAGNTYSKVAHVLDAAGDKYRQEIWVAANVTGHASNVVTATWSASVEYRGIVVMQYSGLNTTTPLDDTKQYVGSAPHTTPTLTGTTADSVHILMSRWGFGSTGFPAGFTEFTTAGAGVPEVADKIVTGGAFSGTYTVTSANVFVIAAIFKAAGAPSATEGRLTQDVLELVSRPTPGVRLTHDAVELLGDWGAVEGRVTHDVIELLAENKLVFENAPLTIGLTYMRLTSRSGDVYAWSDRPLPDPDWYESGWKAARVTEWGRIRRALSGFDGQYETSDFIVTLDDSDRLLRELDRQGEIVNSTVIVKMISDDNRRALQPWTTVYRGVVRDARPTSQLLYELVIKDPFAELFAVGANPVPARTIIREDFPNCGIDRVTSSAEGYQVAASTSAPAGTVALASGAGVGTFVDGDQFTFAGHATVYTVSVTTMDDPETSVTFTPDLTDSVTAGELLTLRATRTVTPTAGDPVPFVYGHITDRYLVDGIDTGDGQAPVIYVGDRVLDDGNTWGEFLWAGHACYAPDGKPIPVLYFWNETLDYISGAFPGVIGDLATEADVGGRVCLPGFPNWAALGFTSLVYVDYNDRWYTVFFLRGILRDWALGIRNPPPNFGGVPLTIDGYGCDTTADGLGTLISDGLLQYRHLLQNWCPPRGAGYQSGPWLPTLTFLDDPTVPMIDEASFDIANAQSAIYMADADSSGAFRGDFIVGAHRQQISVRDLLARLNVSFGVDAGFSRHAQYFVNLPNTDADTLARVAPLGWERDIFAKTFHIEARTRDLYTSLDFRYTEDYCGRMPGGWRSIMTDGSTLYTPHPVVTNDSAVTLYGADTTFSQVKLYMVRGKHKAVDPDEYARGSATAEIVINLKLRRTSYVQHIPILQTGPAGFNYDLADLFDLTHYEGLSADGWTDHLVRIERIEIDPSTYTTFLETYDYDPMLYGLFVAGVFNPAVYNDEVFNTGSTVVRGA